VKPSRTLVVLSMRLVSVSVVLGGLLCGGAVRAQLPASDLVDDLGRLTYDARSAGMGGAALAVEGLQSAPVENAATLARHGQQQVSLNYYGGSNAAGPFGSPEFFRAATPSTIVSPNHFSNLWGWAQGLRGRRGWGEITVLGVVGEGSWRLFGTKGALGYADMTTVTDSTGDHLTVRGSGTEYETLGGAYGWSLGHDTWMGLSVREARWYRATLDFQADRPTAGTITVDDSRTTIARGLEWAADVSVFHRPSDEVALGAVLRHANAPRFHQGTGSVAWTAHPSLDVGGAYHRPGSKNLYALDIRNVTSTDGGRPIFRLGWERDLSHEGRWRGRLGLRDGKLTAGIGWHAEDGQVDLAFGPNPTRELALSASFSF
jgi:hypothetical protein